MVHVVVCGGGFGGLPAAGRLRELLDPSDTVTVIAADDRFFMGFAKLWALSGQRPLADGTRSLTRLEERGIRFVHDTVEEIDPSGLTVETSRGGFDADGIVVALGAAPPARHRDLLADDDAYDLYDGDTVNEVRRRISGVAGGTIAIAILGGPFKCPPAPYEAALIVDELLRERGVRDDVRVVVATPQPLTVPAAGVDASQFVASFLEERGVEVLTEHRVSDVSPGQLSFADHEPLPFDLLLGVPADHPLDVVADSALSDEDGWIRPDPATFATGFDRVYAIGDCTVVPTAGGALPHAGVFAAGGGRVAAANLAADLHGGPPVHFDGSGYCFLELPGEQVAFVEGNFYADPPDVSLTEPSHRLFQRKREYETSHLERWLP